MDTHSLLLVEIWIHTVYFLLKLLSVLSLTRSTSTAASPGACFQMYSTRPNWISSVYYVIVDLIKLCKLIQTVDKMKVNVW